MNLKDAFWNWVVAHAQTIQNVEVHLACLEMRVAGIKFWFNLLRCMTKTPDATLQ